MFGKARNGHISPVGLVGEICALVLVATPLWVSVCHRYHPDASRGGFTTVASLASMPSAPVRFLLPAAVLFKAMESNFLGLHFSYIIGNLSWINVKRDYY